MSVLSKRTVSYQRREQRLQAFALTRKGLAGTRRARTWGLFYCPRTPDVTKGQGEARVEEKSLRLLARRRENLHRVSQEQAERVTYGLAEPSFISAWKLNGVVMRALGLFTLKAWAERGWIRHPSCLALCLTERRVNVFR